LLRIDTIECTNRQYIPNKDMQDILFRTKEY